MAPDGQDHGVGFNNEEMVEFEQPVTSIEAMVNMVCDKSGRDQTIRGSP